MCDKYGCVIRRFVHIQKVWMSDNNYRIHRDCDIVSTIQFFFKVLNQCIEKRIKYMNKKVVSGLDIVS